MGSAHPLNAPYQAYRTADGWICVGAANQRNWERLIELIGALELGAEPRFATNHDRMVNRAALEAELNAVFARRSTARWLEVMEAGGLPAGPVLDVLEMHADPQTQARDMVVEVDHPAAGRLRTLGLPVKFSGTPGGVRRPAPRLGEHTAEILAELAEDDRRVPDDRRRR
jgi:crotonobetainyl-CoA:carnitine CoA-transferase CaiB-like acyl-CoA transferase